MKKVYKSKVAFLAFLFIIVISAFSIIAYAKKQSNSQIKDCCIKPKPAESSEMLWDILSRQFVSAAQFR